MKIHIEHNGTSITIERAPMPPERFAILSKLAGAAIGGGVLLGAIHMIGVWAIGGALVALVAFGLYKLGE